MDELYADKTSKLVGMDLLSHIAEHIYMVAGRASGKFSRKAVYCTDIIDRFGLYTF